MMVWKMIFLFQGCTVFSGSMLIFRGVGTSFILNFWFLKTNLQVSYNTAPKREVQKTMLEKLS